jgi:hypothetical protein
MVMRSGREEPPSLQRAGRRRDALPKTVRVEITLTEAG